MFLSQLLLIACSNMFYMLLGFVSFTSSYAYGTTHIPLSLQQSCISRYLCSTPVHQFNHPPIHILIYIISSSSSIISNNNHPYQPHAPHPSSSPSNNPQSHAAPYEYTWQAYTSTIHHCVPLFDGIGGRRMGRLVVLCSG